MTTTHDPAGETQHEVFGPYLVYERLGIGGMATVHRAKERGIEGFERMVALKRLLPHLAEDESFVRSFVREAKLASLLQHANIVQLYELGRVGPVYFISMELIEGRDVRKVLRQSKRVTGPPPINVTVALLLQLCDALDYAHTRADEDGVPLGLVHRDVSPSNLLITGSGHLKIIDFGIAKAQSTQLRTQTGRVKGKLAYMAPESVTGQALDGRSDLFSVGIIAHELLTARPLFATKNDYKTLMRVQKAPVAPPSAQNLEVPPELDAIVLKALSKDRDQRWASAADMREELHRLRRHYQYNATNREVSHWCQWAFSQELTEGSVSRSITMAQQDSRSLGPSDSDLMPRLDRARLAGGVALGDDDEVDMVWGSAAEDAARPVLLDDVPDVSHKIPTPASQPPISPSQVEGTPAQRAATSPTDDVAYVVGAAPRGDEPGQVQVRAGSRRPGARQRAASIAPGASGAGALGLTSTAPPLPGAFGPGSGAFSSAGAGAPSEGLPPAPALGRGTTTTHRVDDEMPVEVPLVESSERARMSTEFGAGIVAQHRSSRWRVMAIAGGVLAVCGALLLLRTAGSDGRDSSAQPPRFGHVRLLVEPSDAVVLVDGKTHDEVPHEVELAVGDHSVEIRRQGYRSWISTLEVAANENQTVRVVLEKASSGATVAVRSTPPGLIVKINGETLMEATPTSVEVETGSHVISLENEYGELWRRELDAESNTHYELQPNLEREALEAHKKELRRRKREERAQPTQQTPSKAPVVVDEAALPAQGGLAASRRKVPGMSFELELRADAPPEAPALRAPLAQKPTRSGPLTVSAGAMKKRTGSLPTLGGLSALPRGRLAVELCVDAAGKVRRVGLPSNLSYQTSRPLELTLYSWRYEPYRDNGKAVPVCFTQSFQVK